MVNQERVVNNPELQSALFLGSRAKNPDQQIVRPGPCWMLDGLWKGMLDGLRKGNYQCGMHYQIHTSAL